MTVHNFCKLKSGTIIEAHSKFYDYIAVRCRCKYGFIVLDSNNREHLGRHIRIYRPGDPFKMHCGGTVISGYNIDPATISKLDKSKYKICTDECKEEWGPE